MRSIFHPSVFTTWWTLGTVISTSVFYKLSEESYIRHGKLDSSIMLNRLSIVPICYVVVGDSGFHYAISFLHPTQTINWSNFKRVNDIVIHCDTWDLLISFSISIRHCSSIYSYTHHPFLFLIGEPIGFREDPLIPIIWDFMPRGSACRNRRHSSHAGFDPQSPLAWTVLL